jgi:hypothetical protein
VNLALLSLRAVFLVAFGLLGILIWNFYINFQARP